MSKKILSVCLALVFLCTLAVPVFAAEGDENYVSNWYNTQQPYNETVYYYDAQNENDFAYYYETGLKFSNAASSNTSIMGFGFSDEAGIGGWELSMSNAYDYYINVICFAETTAVTDFTFYPTDFDIEYNAHNGGPVYRNLDDISISHYDTSHTLGYSSVGRIPRDEYFGCPIRALNCFEGSGTVPANLQVFILVYQVPKLEGGVSADGAAIVAAINNQTTQYLSKIDQQTNILGGLIQGNGGDPDADSANSELSEVIGQVDQIEQDIHLQAQEAFNAADSIVNQFDPATFSNAGNLYKELSQNAFSSLSLISVFILIPLILFCVGAFIGKLK